jgi:hypothetical protein
MRVRLKTRKERRRAIRGREGISAKAEWLEELLEVRPLRREMSDRLICCRLQWAG